MSRKSTQIVRCAVTRGDHKTHCREPCRDVVEGAATVRNLGTVLIAALLIHSSPVHAGNNFGGSGFLSWSATAGVGDLAAVPPGPTPLYLLLSGAPDIRSLAVELKWSPNDLVGPCYYLIPTSSGGPPTCGWTSYVQPSEVFEGDSTYSWTITFGGASHSCVMYMVGGDNCQGTPASFCLTSLNVVDSNGAIDDLAILAVRPSSGE